MDDGESGRASAGVPRPGGPDDPPPPRREQLPLPRRTGQRHLEPRLRDPDTAPGGTPFEAFTAQDAPAAQDAPRDPAQAFQDGVRQARRRVRNGRPSRRSTPAPGQSPGRADPPAAR